METHSIHYTPAKGWSSVFPALDSAQTLVLVFGPAAWQAYTTALCELLAHYPKAIIVGCSGYGVISKGEILDDTLVVSVTHFQQTQLRLVTCPVASHDESLFAGQVLGHELASPDLQATLLFSDGLSTNGSTLIAGLNSKLPPSTVVIGGLAGDSQSFTSTWVMANQLPQGQLACALGFYGKSIQFKTAIQVGWSALGPERQVTLASGNKLYTLDNKPALELYKQYLGLRATEITKNSLNFPLAIRSKGKPYTLIRTPMVLDEASQTLIFAGDIPENSTAQLVHVSATTLVDGAYAAGLELDKAIALHQEQPMLILTISCGARRAVMAEDAGLELDAACSAFSKTIHQVGFYSFGELAPHNVKLEPKNSPYCATKDCTTCLATPSYGLCELHNQTITLTAIYEQ
ncbi:MAG TPA: FIST N-terminal domain-containing protein [Thiolinea sp.]|nr:FIST N-terminal domain-containing protein [Thiolinea sp.]